MRRLITIGFASLFLPFAAAETPVDGLKAARKAFEDSVAKAREAFLGGFDKAQATVRTRTGITAEERLTLVKLIGDEKAVFVGTGKLPNAAGMKYYVIDYIDAVARAEVALGLEYDKVIEALTKKGETEKASNILAEKKAAAEEADRRWVKAAFSALLGTWAVETKGKGADYKANWKFDADGSATSDNGESKTGKWKVDRTRRRIVILWDGVARWDTFLLPINADNSMQGESWSKRKLVAVKTK